MEIRTEDYEKLGAFYLGRDYNLSKKELGDDLVLYDSKDLVTHGVVLGMTGSGKTGLCLALLEEAAMDNIPAIVIDPKGDIANILLTFPDLAPSDFRPWINEEDATKKGVTPDEFAAKQADLWRKGLADWGQGPERIRSFRDKVDLTVYTPGSNAGLPVSILSSLDVPDFEVLDDAELLAERIESTVSSLLSLVGVDADPIKDPRHILLSNIFSTAWRAGQGITLESLIRHIQRPPFDKIGVMGIDKVIPEDDRQDLAMKMNNLLASPGFSAWLQGEPLDIKRMLHTPEGKPRISIFSIAHLSDTERMFFVSLLLNQTLGWMRAQSGTTSLRALLYMDEIYGYLPPTANPPSKKPMMTMLKQARAFGLGLLLATQNPVDLDYKALSNIGTWWLGRLQTERDKMRVLDGLEGAASSNEAGFDRSKMEQLLAGLGARVFLMNNVHEDAPLVFHVRWVMSYLRGPLARRQIKELMDPKRPAEPAPGSAAATADAPKPEAPKPLRPRLPKGVAEYFIPAGAGVPANEINYVPAVVRVGEVRYNDAKKGVAGSREVVYLNKVDPAAGTVDWSQNLPLPNDLKMQQLSVEPLEGATFTDPPQTLIESKTWSGMEKDLVDWLYSNDSLTLFHSPLTGEYSRIGEAEGDFRARLLHSAHEIRDAKVEELRKSFEKKIDAAESRVEKAMDTLDEQKSQANSAKLSTAINIGSTILGAVLGRRVSSRTSSAMSGASRAWKESRDVARAEDEVEKLEEALAELEEECEKEIEALKEAMDPMKEQFETERLTPLKKDCSAKAIGVVWMPFRVQTQPTLGAAW
ncbi:MAG: DUF87 domain-containing protein [Verrucomicrobiae bacterium]|nr:DUF87 domain-containing protein [Verrucomicrobiae bacterium]MCP5539184.1 DUF87 domain-containing protein [Akkermansiaceae bacterium]MCP5549835.1 DUF87 domain-containing protein [Akkermansiaceae bacterium]